LIVQVSFQANAWACCGCAATPIPTIAITIVATAAPTATLLFSPCTLPAFRFEIDLAPPG
jgi:hypothetical protein